MHPTEIVKGKVTAHYQKLFFTTEDTEITEFLLLFLLRALRALRALRVLRGEDILLCVSVVRKAIRAA
jgi:hypothetical protein